VTISVFVRKIFKWLFASLGVLLIVTIVAGRIYQVTSESADLARFPPPGQLVDVDGHLMHIHCQGQGSPTVVIEQGLQGVSSSWEDITRQIAHVTRVCAYDRVGLGYSEPIDHPTRATEVAELLHKLLRGAGVDDDLVLVGWSAGGVYIREYQRLYPERVKAMLLVDSSHEQQQIKLPQSPESGRNLTLKIARYLAPIGLVRLSGIARGQIEHSPVPDKLKPRLIALYQQSHVIQTMLNESEAFTLDTQAKQPPASLGDLPLIVLTPGKSTEQTGPGVTAEYIREKQKAWEEMQLELVGLSTKGKQIIAAESGHGIQYDQPELLIASVYELVQLVRDQQRQDD
jgi:pimeloyl-ACP methyl ester carboxylesterase